MAFAADDALAPSTVNSSVERTREYLTANEVEELIATARKSSRYGHGDATMKSGIAGRNERSRSHHPHKPKKASAL
jgi:hypothetical protein